MYKLHNVQGLLAFLTAAECGSINKAAAALHVSQPALTRTIMLFEKSIGHALLERTSRGVRLTAAGEQVKAQGLLVRNSIRRVEEEIGRLDSRQRETFRLAAVPLGPAPVLAEVLLELTVRHPEVEFHVSEPAPELALKLLEQGEIEMIVGISENAYKIGHLIADTLTQSSAAIYCSHAHRLAGVPKVDLAELCDERWVLGPGAVSVVELAFRRHGIAPPRPRLLLDEPALRMRVVAGSDFISVFRSMHVNRGAEKLVRIDCNWPANVTAISAVRLLPHTALSLEVVETLRRHFAQDGA